MKGLGVEERSSAKYVVEIPEDVADGKSGKSSFDNPSLSSDMAESISNVPKKQTEISMNATMMGEIIEPEEAVELEAIDTDEWRRGIKSIEETQVR